MPDQKDIPIYPGKLDQWRSWLGKANGFAGAAQHAELGEAMRMIALAQVYATLAASEAITNRLDDIAYLVRSDKSDRKVA